MLKTLCVIFSVNALCWGFSETKNNANTPIRVLLESRAKLVDIRPLAGHLLFQIDQNPQWDLARRLQIEWLDEATLRINGQSMRASVVRLRPASSGAHFQYNAQVHAGDLVVHSNTDGFSVINQLPLESYLVGTLAAEMNPSWPLEALKAQAIASRSFALDAIRQSRYPLYDIESTTKDQVFSGAGIVTPQVERAVKETQGLVLSQDSHPLKAYFHSRCGGTTQTPREVWQSSSQQFQSVDCPFCQKNPDTWTTAVARTELARAFGLPISTGPITLTAKKNPSGRITELTAQTESVSRSLPTNTFRARLGYNRLRSALFDWKLSESGVRFTGRGYGHGVGMCQWGARYLAHQGKDFLSILKHYYPGARVSSG